MFSRRRWKALKNLTSPVAFFFKALEKKKRALFLWPPRVAEKANGWWKTKNSWKLYLAQKQNSGLWEEETESKTRMELRWSHLMAGALGLESLQTRHPVCIIFYQNNKAIFTHAPRPWTLLNSLQSSDSAALNIIHSLTLLTKFAAVCVGRTPSQAVEKPGWWRWCVPS